jgi:hypothetical protein
VATRDRGLGHVKKARKKERKKERKKKRKEKMSILVRFIWVVFFDGYRVLRLI